MSSSYNLATDIKEAVAMAEGLTSYVRGDQLYGNAGGGFFSAIPSLTVGALLMRLRRLHELRDHLEDRQIKSLDHAVDLYQETRSEWTRHYEEKMLLEAKSRIEAMNQFFKECAESLVKCGNVYRPELLRRTIVQELLMEMEEMGVEDSALTRRVKEADAKLRGFLHDDEFQWDERLKEVYPQSDFWWLYQKPPKPDES